VSLYERHGTTWSRGLSVPTPDVAIDGPEVGLDGSRLVIGSRPQVSGIQAKLTAYERGPLGWTVAGSTGLAVRRFALSGNRVHLDSGKTLELDAGQWSEVGEFAPPDDALHFPELLKAAGPLMAGLSWSWLTEYNHGAIVTFGLDGRRASLHASTSMLALTTGGTLELTLDSGPENAGAVFALAGSLEGTFPGFELLGAHIPLTAHDPYFPHSTRMGRLDGDGKAMVEVEIPAIVPGSPLGFLKDRTLHHAFVVVRPRRGIVHVSNVALTALVGTVPR